MTPRAVFLALALLAWDSTGCGQVTETPEPEQTYRGESRDGAVPDGDPQGDTVSTSETSPPACSILAGCAACTGFRSPATCAAIIACVREGTHGDYPWQSCANLHADSLNTGTACAQQLDKACP